MGKRGSGLVALLLLGLARLAGAQGFEFAKVVRIEGQVLVKLGDGEWEPATEGGQLRAKDEVGTGPESQAQLEFPDGSVAEIKELSQVQIGTLLAAGDGAKIRLLLRLGEIEAEVPEKAGVKSDFSVNTPISTASVRGTQIRVVHYTPSRGFYTFLRRGTLAVDSTSDSVTLTPGFDAEVEPDGEMLTSWQLDRDTSRTALEPGGMTEREVERIETSMEPEPFPREATTPSMQEDNGSTLLLRVEVQGP